MDIFIKFNYYYNQGIKKKIKLPRQQNLLILITSYWKGAQANLALNINCS